MRQQKDNSTKNPLQPSETNPAKSTIIVNEKHCIMINHSLFSHGLVNDLTNKQHSSDEVGCNHIYV